MRSFVRTLAVVHLLLFLGLTVLATNRAFLQSVNLIEIAEEHHEPLRKIPKFDPTSTDLLHHVLLLQEELIHARQTAHDRSPIEGPVADVALQPPKLG